MPEDLRSGREQRHDGRLIDVAPLRMETADDEVQLVAEEPIVRIPDQMNQNDDARSDRRHDPVGA